MQVVKPLTIASDTTFVSPFEYPGGGKIRGFFCSFIAIAPRHHILKITFKLLLKHYQQHGFGKEFENSYLSSGFLFTSYKQFADNSTNKAEWPLDTALEETRLSRWNYPSFPRLDGVGCCCDFVVHNKTERDIYFYSRIVGVDFCQHKTPETAVAQRNTVSSELRNNSRLKVLRLMKMHKHVMLRVK